MTVYAGLELSDESTHICVVDGDGAALRRDVVASDPEALAKWLGKHCADLTRVVLKTGPLSTFLYHGLVEGAVPMRKSIRQRSGQTVSETRRAISCCSR